MSSIESDGEWEGTLYNIGQVPAHLLESVDLPMDSVQHNGRTLKLSAKWLDQNKNRDELPDLPKFKDGDSKYYLSVENSDGKAVAIGILSLYQKEGYLEAKSSIIVKDEERGNGIASALIEPSLKILQLIANQRKTPIALEIRNGNLEKLQQLEDEEAGGDAIEAKQAEQDRWQHLYGKGGKFGVTAQQEVTMMGQRKNEMFQVFFYPDDSEKTIGGITDSIESEVKQSLE